ncbi:MAG: protein-L-isoaspartate(D-aspartate) O-methyltransferase [Candidatus Omnitrophica bacterium]|nr:protein-L-isoaspartate(D-aspartate) O-methyltransferase [Candidatus Omnitrophota bacterium]
MKAFSAAILFFFFFSVAPLFPETDPYTHQRRDMVARQIKARGVTDERVLNAMMKVERHLFIDKRARHLAYEDHPVSIGFDQAISQPYIVAFMTEALHLAPQDRVLEIGTGSGYQAAILAELAGEVYSIEIIKDLADRSKKLLEELEYENIFIKHGDGYKGWPEFAPFDAIMVTAAPKDVPETLIAQLKIGGRLIIPVGSFFQELVLIVKTESGIQKSVLLPVRFVPMIKDSTHA